MAKKLIYFSDLSHTDQVIASEFMPYSVACVASFFLANSRYAGEFDVEVFKFPEDLIKALGEREPFALAQLKTASILCLTRMAVSVFSAHIGWRQATTSLVSIESISCLPKKG